MARFGQKDPELGIFNLSSGKRPMRYAGERGGALSKRYRRLACPALCLFVLAFFFVSYTRISDVVIGSPPHYREFHEYERTLPQHDLSLPAPEGKHAKFLFFRNHIYELGWGNFMQELLLNSHMAYSANRSFVFYNYTWFGLSGDEFRLDNQGRRLPNRFPLSSMISGPTVGGPYPPGTDVPRAVALEYYRKVCKNPTMIRSERVSESMPNAPADQLIRKWVEVLNEVDDPCVEIDHRSPQVFDFWVFGNHLRILGAWQELRSSPIIAQFRWSGLVVSAFEKNRHLFFASDDRDLPVRIPSYPHYHPHSQSAPIPGLLAMHIRRGDFEEHCGRLATYGSRFNGFASFPELPDQFVVPEELGTPALRAQYARACFPTVAQIVDKVREVRATRVGAGLDRVYVMTNANASWVAELERALAREAKWAAFATKRELVLTDEQRYVAQALDMMIGQRAQVVIGNGFSSLSSNIAMLRMARGFPPESTRFW